eukprot:1159640-Pelagomonas_calceolata.AAC.10
MLCAANRARYYDGTGAVSKGNASLPLSATATRLASKPNAEAFCYKPTRTAQMCAGAPCSESPPKSQTRTTQTCADAPECVRLPACL